MRRVTDSESGLFVLRGVVSWLVTCSNTCGVHTHTHKQHTYKHTPQKCVLQHLIRGHLTNHMIYYPQHIRRQGVREFNKTTYHYATYKHYRERTKKPCYTHNIPVPLLHNVETNKKCIVNEALIKTLCCIVVGVLHVHHMYWNM